MKIHIKTRPNSKEGKVVKISDIKFIVSVKEPPIHGLANKAIVNALAVYFGIASARVKVVSGYTSRQKVIEIL